MDPSPFLEDLIKEFSKITQQIEAISAQKIEGEAPLQEIEKLNRLEEYIQWFNKVNILALRGVKTEKVKPTEELLHQHKILEELRKKLEQLENIYREKVEQDEQKESKKNQKKKIIKRRKKFNRLGGDNRFISS